ncbi:MAG: lamin tail domain-containing protein [Bacteroidales bacterium]|nr:lamin tail domain-containing protein [Bacteroidales bacterium]
MHKYYSLLVFLFFPFVAAAQFTDNFSDGNFTSNPPWGGDTDKFVVESGVLRLNDSQAGQSYLATQSSLALEVQWEFWVRLAFTPSTNNHPKIYLVSDAQNLKEPLNGYFIQIGRDGGENKRLYLFRQDGETTTELLAGSQNLASTTNNIMRIRVTRDEEGVWELWADPAGGQMFIPQGSVTDLTHTQTAWFGMVCNYTVTNANRFYFDDFVVSEIVPDLQPPIVNVLEVVSANQLNVHFSKLVEPGTAQDPDNYYVNQGIGNPLTATINSQQPNVVKLFFVNSFEENLYYELQADNVEDFSGNVMEHYSGSFVLYVAQRNDLVFNELMADPTPEVGLPAFEYIELYNTSEFPVNIDGWVLQHGSTQRVLPFGLVEPGGFVLLVAEAAVAAFQPFGNVVGVPGLSATALTNAGTSLLLFDREERLVSFVNYSDSWYGNPAKAGGGWSLEKIDPMNFCQGAGNWIASESPLGGTPGAPNSVLGSNPDHTPPDLLRIGYVDETVVKLFFSETMDEEGLMGLVQTADFGLGSIHSVQPLLPDFSAALLTLANPLDAGLIYEVTLPAQVTDCAGNQLGRRTARVAVPRAAETFDVVINEVLFNPPDGGSRYIELFNRSEKVIELRDYSISSKDTIQGFLTTIREIISESYLLFPGDFVVLTTNPAAVLNTFMTTRPHAFIGVAAMPSMTNTSGVLALASKSLTEIDLFAYHEDMHFALLTNKKGVALERINPNRPAQDRSNWHSAAQSAGFGTPAYQNSQYSAELSSHDGEIEVYPEVFSPDSDGHDDLLTISYRFDQPGFVASVRIFDSRGRLIRNLARAELLAVNGAFTWDGTTDDYQKAPIGIYIIHVEVTDLAGNVNHYRKTAVLGGRL